MNGTCSASRIRPLQPRLPRRNGGRGVVGSGNAALANIGAMPWSRTVSSSGGGVRRFEQAHHDSARTAFPLPTLRQDTEGP
jgi:hypothetical protein